MHTIYSQVAKRSRSSTLDFDVWTVEQEEDRLKRSAVDRPNICASLSGRFLPFQPYASYLFP